MPKTPRRIVALAIHICFGALAVPVAAIAAPNPIAAYSFDEGGGTTVTDASGNNYAGVLKNGPTWTDGRHNRALSLDGSNDYVTSGQVAGANGVSAFTVSAWVKFGTSGGGSRETHLVDKSGCDGHVNSGPWELGVALTAPGKAEVLVYPENGTPTAYIFSGASTTSVDDGNWHYLTGRYDGSRLSVWVDGRQENSVAASGLRLSSTTKALEFGGHCNGYAYPFRGALDEVRIYARALSQSEIQADMTTALGGSAPAPAPGDSTPPSSPTGLTAIHKTATEASFSWAPSTDNVAVNGYRISRNGAQVGTSAQTTYADSGLTPNTSYVYTVAAYDAAGNSSSPSQPLSITTNAASGGGGGGGGTTGASYATSFNSTENPLSEGGRWRRANNKWTNVVTVGGVAFGTNAGQSYDDSYSLLSGFGPDQTVEAVVYRDQTLQPVSTHEIELLLRFSDDSGNARGYECLFDYYGGFAIMRWNGPQGDFAHVHLVASGYLGRQLVTGDVIKATIVGNTITMSVNGMLLAKGIDSAFSNGQPGIGFFIRPDGSNKLLGVTSYSASSPTSQ